MKIKKYFTAKFSIYFTSMDLNAIISSMIVTFCGHSKYYYDVNLMDELLKIMEKEFKVVTSIDFYLGGYGKFDEIALNSCVEYKQRHNNVKLHYIIPYLDDIYLKNRKEIIDKCDEVIYPELEKTHRRYAIIKRNYWMAKKSDLVFAYVVYPWGGASKMLEYARKLKKRIINIAK